MSRMPLETVVPRQRASIYHVPEPEVSATEVVVATSETCPRRPDAKLHAWVGNSEPQLARKLPSWLVSLILHLLLLVGLALLTIPRGDATVIELDVGLVAEEELPEQDIDLSLAVFEDDTNLEELDLEELVESEIEIAETFQVATAVAQPSGGGQEGEGFGEMVARLKKTGLDISIVFDSTGSMHGEIDQVKNDIERICNTLVELIPKTRIGICTYRDRDEEYVVKGQKLTKGVKKVVTFLDQVSADGGGDAPESVEAGLAWAIEMNSWRRSARKVILVFGDAPPHKEKIGECEQMAGQFRSQWGGIVSTVTCQKDPPLDSFTRIAEAGGGSSFLARDERLLMTQLMVLVFGSKHRQKVIEAFDLMDRQEPEKRDRKRDGKKKARKRIARKKASDRRFRSTISKRAASVE